MTEEYKAQYSIKVGPSGNDMLNFRANTAEELRDLMKAASDNAAVMAGYAESIKKDVLELAPAVASVQKEFPETTSVSSGGNAAPVCAHQLPKVWKTGTKKDGSPWSGWFCQAPKEGLNGLPQCAVDWKK